MQRPRRRVVSGHAVSNHGWFGDCDNAAGNWDHCFSRDGVTCIGESQGGNDDYVSDGAGIRVYDPAFTADALLDAGLGDLVPLQTCYNPLAIMHWYGPFGDDDRLDHEADGWVCDDDRIGWVYPLGVVLPDDAGFVEKGIVATVKNLHYGFVRNASIRGHHCYEFEHAFIAWELNQ